MISDTAVASDVVIIQAPAELVWSILVDFERYSEWNRFCPQIKSTLELGAAVDDFSGKYMPAMLEKFGVGIERGFNRCASDLKEYAEQHYQRGSA